MNPYAVRVERKSNRWWVTLSNQGTPIKVRGTRVR